MSDQSDADSDTSTQENDLSTIFIRDGRPLNFVLHDSIRNPGAQLAVTHTIENSGGVVVDSDDDADIVLFEPRPGWNQEQFQNAYSTHSDLKKRKIVVRELGWVQKCIRSRTVRLTLPLKKRKPGHPQGRGRTPYNKSDDEHICQYLATKCPDPLQGGRLSQELYDTMVMNYQWLPDEFGWVTRHPPQSWRNRYKKNRERMDRRIQEIVDQNPNAYHRPARPNRSNRASRKLRLSDFESSEEEEQEEQTAPVDKGPDNDTARLDARVRKNKGKQRAMEVESEGVESDNERPSSLFSADDEFDNAAESLNPDEPEVEWGQVHETVFAPQQNTNAGPSNTARSRAPQQSSRSKPKPKHKRVAVARSQPRSPDRTLVTSQNPGFSTANLEQQEPSSSSKPPNASDITAFNDAHLDSNTHDAADFTLQPDSTLPMSDDLPQIEHLEMISNERLPAQRAPSPPSLSVPSPKRKRKKASHPQPDHVSAQPVDSAPPYRSTRSRSRSVEPVQLPITKKTRKKRGPRADISAATQALHPLQEAEEMMAEEEEGNVESLLMPEDRSYPEENISERDRTLPLSNLDDARQRDEDVGVGEFGSEDGTQNVLSPESRPKRASSRKPNEQPLDTDDEQVLEFIHRAGASALPSRDVSVPRMLRTLNVPRLSKSRPTQAQAQTRDSESLMPPPQTRPNTRGAPLMNTLNSSRNAHSQDNDEVEPEDAMNVASKRRRPPEVPVRLDFSSGRPRKVPAPARAAPQPKRRLGGGGSVTSDDFPIKGTSASAKKQELVDQEKRTPLKLLKSTRAARAARR